MGPTYHPTDGPHDTFLIQVGRWVSGWINRLSLPSGPCIAVPATAAALFMTAFVAAALAGDLFEEGVDAFEHGDYARAFQKWRPLAESDPRAATNLGVLYADGLGVQRNTEEALRWLGPAAIVGNATAQTRLGMLFAEGTGSAPNFEAAAIWYQRAAEKGYPNAQVLLGLAYAAGEGVLQDYVAAHMWINLAVAKLPPGKGRDSALETRDLIAKKMTPGQIAEAQELARKWKSERPK
jgi:hypothetical protein